MADIIHGISINYDGKLDVQLSGDDFVRNEDGTIGVATGAGTGEALTAGGGIDITNGEVSVKLGGVETHSSATEQGYVGASVFYNQASAGLTLRVSSRLSANAVGEDMCLTVNPAAFVEPNGPLQTNSIKALYLKYGSGLTYDSTKGLIIDDNTVTTLAAAEVAKVVASAPEDLDTLKEIADYIASDKTNAAEINNTLSAHTTSIAALETGKQDKLSAGNGISLSGAFLGLDLSEYHASPNNLQAYGTPLFNDAQGLALKVGTGLELDENNFLKIKVGSGLTVGDDNYLKVKTGSGLASDGDENLNIQVGSGLTVLDTENKLTLRVSSGLELGLDGVLRIKAGSGLVSDPIYGLIIPEIKPSLNGDEFEGLDSNAVKAPLFYKAKEGLCFSIGTGLRLDKEGTLFIDYEDLASRLAPYIAQTSQTT